MTGRERKIEKGNLFITFYTLCTKSNLETFGYFPRHRWELHLCSCDVEIRHVCIGKVLMERRGGRWIMKLSITKEEKLWYVFQEKCFRSFIRRSVRLNSGKSISTFNDRDFQVFAFSRTKNRCPVPQTKPIGAYDIHCRNERSHLFFLNILFFLLCLLVCEEDKKYFRPNHKKASFELALCIEKSSAQNIDTTKSWVNVSPYRSPFSTSIDYLNP